MITLFRLLYTFLNKVMKPILPMSSTNKIINRYYRKIMKLRKSSAFAKTTVVQAKLESKRSRVGGI